MNRNGALEQLEHMREWLRARVNPAMEENERKRVAKKIAAISYALEEMHRMEDLER